MQVCFSLFTEFSEKLSLFKISEFFCKVTNATLIGGGLYFRFEKIKEKIFGVCKGVCRLAIYYTITTLYSVIIFFSSPF